MKREARVLVSRCKGGVCAGYILRFPGIDGFSASLQGCAGLCSSLEEQGYLGEARFYVGDCGCGLEKLGQAPGEIAVLAEAYMGLAESIATSLSGALARCRENAVKSRER